MLSNVHPRHARRDGQHRRRRSRAARARACASDEDDPYLVVAADKGTATFSDIANAHLGRVRLLARRRVRVGRLGGLRPQEDGDHRARRVGVREAPLPRARRGHAEAGVHGGRHRRHERRRVRQRHAAVAAHQAGGGVRSSCTSSSTRTPTPRASFVERQRLFELPRSSWDDYDRSADLRRRRRVLARSAKSIALRPHAQAVLGPAEPRR